jgi:uncharacterized protein (DUF362 family)
MRWSIWLAGKETLEMIRIYVQKAKALYRKLTQPKVLWPVNTSRTMPPRLSAQGQEMPVFAFRGSDSVIVHQMAEQADRFFMGFKPNDRVLIKINHNTAAPYPASTDPRFLEAVLDLLILRGITRIKVGDCSAVTHLPTQKVFAASGIPAALKGKAKLVCFDRCRWVRVPVRGEYLNRVTVPECIFETDRIIYIANCKTHQLADFSLAMKLAVGFMHPYERYALHEDHLHEKIAEISLAVQPDLVILDARKTFITGGPDEGRVVSGNTVFVGTNLIQTDVEGYRLLYTLKSDSGCVGSFSEDPYEMAQFRHARKMIEEGRWQ